MPSSARRTIRTSVVLPESCYAQVQAMAAANDVSASWIVRQAVTRFLAESEGQTELPLQLRKA
jgi:predicted transcriptional regulator